MTQARHPSGEGSFTAAPPGPRRTVSRAQVVREYESLNGLREDEQRDLERFALAQSTEERSQHRAVFALRNGRLHAQNYVGIIETRRGTVIEILPKVDLTSDLRHQEEGPAGTAPRETEGDHDVVAGEEEDTRRVFLAMLRDWRGLGEAQLAGAGIRAIRRMDIVCEGGSCSSHTFARI